MVLRIGKGAGKRVFVSYAYQDPDHVEAVRQLWQLLLANGVNARLDVDATATRQDWPVWMMTELKAADYVVVVASPAYRKRADGEAAPGEGKGVQFEGALLRELIYTDRRKWFPRILPVLLPGQSTDGIPLFLSPSGGSSYRVDALTTDGIQGLLHVLEGKPAPTPPPPPPPVLPTTTPPPPPAARRSSLAEMDHVVTALGKIRELADDQARGQLLGLLDPGIRQYLETGQNTRMHLIAIVRGCARFQEEGRAALLDILRYALPQNDPAVVTATAAVESSWLFDA